MLSDNMRVRPGMLASFTADCDRDFMNSSALEQHLQNKIHTLVQKRKEAYLCEQCDWSLMS